MTKAADIVRMQTDLLDEFRIPDPQARGLMHAVQTAAGLQVRFPVSIMGGLVDHLMFGAGGSASAGVRGLFASTHKALISTPSCAPMVANGLITARAYRVQENMTSAVLARADALPGDTRYGLDEDQIRPPRPAGFAYFCQPLPHLVRPTRTGIYPDPSIGLVTWTAVVDIDDDGEPRELAWLSVVWDDVWRNPPEGRNGRGYHGADTLRCQFVPVTAFAVRPGDLLGGAVLPVRQLGEAQMRSPLHTVGALWQLLGETVPAASGDRVEQAREDTDRADRRRARRAGMADAPEVTTVVLRREHRPVQNPGTGRKPETRVEIDEYEAWRWIGSEKRGDRMRVRRKIRKHWSSRDESLPVRTRTVVSDLRR